jgi:hypothetical protein
MPDDWEWNNGKISTPDYCPHCVHNPVDFFNHFLLFSCFMSEGLKFANESMSA